MNSKFIIVVVLISLGQCSLALPRSVAYGLSAADSTKLTEIKLIQQKTLEVKFNLVNIVFDVLEKYVFKQISGLQVGNDDDLSKIAEARTNAQLAIDYSFDAIQMSLGEYCSAVDAARNASYVHLDNIAEAITGGLALVLSGEYSGAQAELEEYKVMVEQSFEKLVRSVSGAISICLHIENVDALAAFEKSKHGSASAAKQMIDIIFSVIKIYASLDTFETENGLLISNVMGLRKLALASFRVDVTSKFAGIRTSFFMSKLNNTKIVPELAANQYALILSNYKYEEAGDTMLGSITAALRRVYLGITIGGSSIDADETGALTLLREGSDAFLDSIIYSDATDVVAAARESASKLVSGTMSTFYSAIRAACNSSSTYSEALEIIKTATETLTSENRPTVQGYYTLLRDNKTLDSDTEARVATLQNATLEAYATYLQGIFGAARYLAKAFFSGTASEEDIIAIETYHASVFSGLDDYTQTMSTAGVTILNAISH